MSKFSAAERANYKRIVGMLMKGDPERKREYDVKVRKVLSAMRDAMPEASDEVLAEFASAVGFIAAVILKVPVQEVGGLVQDLFDGYSIAAAELLSVYDPDDASVPNYDRPDLDLAAALDGLDPELVKKIERLIEQSGSSSEQPADRHEHSASAGMYL